MSDSKLLNYLGRITRHGLIGRAVSLKVGFEVSKAHTSSNLSLHELVDQMWALSYCYSITPATELPAMNLLKL